MARSARLRPPRRPRIRIRSNTSPGELACRVHIEPSWPEFMASSIGMISLRRTSPTRMRCGLCRSACAIRSCSEMAPTPSEFGSLASNAITSGCCALPCRNSSYSVSRVAIRSPGPISEASPRSSVVLPAFTPPVTMMLQRLFTAAARKLASVASIVPSWISRARLTFSWPCLRIDTHGRGVTDIVAVIRAPPASATLTSGEAAEKSRAVWPPRAAQLRIIAISSSSLEATGSPATRSPVA